MEGPKTISVNQLRDVLQQSGEGRLIDVRTPREFQEAHVPEATNIPLDALSADRLASEEAAVGKTLYLICKSGGRASRAYAQLSSSGLGDVQLVEGGTDAWVQAGFPVVRGKKAMSLERQVRIAAGSLVLGGVLAGQLWHPAGFGLSAFVGAGLVFAGVTDTCGMAMVLAKMPWNQVASAPSPAVEGSRAPGHKEKGQWTIPS